MGGELLYTLKKDAFVTYLIWKDMYSGKGRTSFYAVSDVVILEHGFLSGIALG